MFLLVTAAPAGAQTSPFFDELQPSPTSPTRPNTAPLGVEIVLGTARGDDHVGIYNVRFDYDETDYSDELGDAVGDALKIPRSKSSVNLGFDDYDTFDFDYDMQLDVEGRLTQSVGDDRKIEIDTAELRRVARNWDYPELELAVCSSLPVTDTSNRPADVDDNCRDWNVAVGAGDVSSAPLTVSVTQNLEPGNYWTVVAVSAIVSVVLMVLFSLMTFVLRRGPFATLGSVNLLTISLLVILGALAWGVGTLIFWGTERPFTDFVVSNDLGSGGAFVTYVVPTLLYSLPFIGPAIVLCFAKPKPIEEAPPLVQQPPYGAPVPPAPQGPPTAPPPMAPPVQPPAGPPGVPTWLNEAPTGAPTPEVAPEAPTPEAPTSPPEPGNDEPPSWRPPS